MKLVSEVNCSTSSNICLFCSHARLKSLQNKMQSHLQKHSASRSLIPQDLLSHFQAFLQSLLLLFYFCVFLSQLSELVWKLAEEIKSRQSASKGFLSFGPPANGNKITPKNPYFAIIETQRERCPPCLISEATNISFA